MNDLFQEISGECSKITTRKYSTSFSLGIKMLNTNLHIPIYSIYGFVRLADEIVDSLHDFNQKDLLHNFETECYDAIKNKISMNPILNSFQYVVNHYKIDLKLIDQFLYSMKMDLDKKKYYNKLEYDKYILGSAEVVGLMCLKVFVKGNEDNYKKLTPFAEKLGAAFQKINFLRDIKNDYEELGRTYFPNIKIESLDVIQKKDIEADIEADFREGLKGIKMLPKSSRGGVYLAYIYYLELLKKIKKMKPQYILKNRVRISNFKKTQLMIKSIIQNKLNWL